MPKVKLIHKLVKESGQLTSFGGQHLLGIYREVAACQSASEWTPQLAMRWARVTCKKCLKLKPDG